MKRLGIFLLGAIFCLMVLVLGGYLYFRFGYAPVATSARPMPLEKRLASMALHAKVQAEAPKNSPIQPDEPNLTAGARVYVEDCAFCHGLPKQAAVPPAAKGMFPVPPQLFEDMVTDDPVGETYWKVSNGIRLTGMPAFSKSLSDTQMWQVSLLMANADKLPDQTKAALKASGK
ncbi:MAG TPA: cytochrome c [Candidatus Angelobacter sp.]|nr:cytochrome c [Candidatus Angelobacter sp.]